MVVVLDCSGSQRCEVRSWVRLREALAPDVLRRQDRGDIPLALFVVAKAQQGRPEHVEADDVDELRRTGGRELLIHDDLLDCGSAAAAELARPSTPYVAGVVAASLPASELGDALIERVRRLHRDVLGEKVPDLFLEPAL